MPCRKCGARFTPREFAEQYAADAAHATEGGFGSLRDELPYFQEEFEKQFDRPPSDKMERVFKNKWEEIKQNQDRPSAPPADRDYGHGTTPREYDRYSRTAKEDNIGYGDIQTSWGGDFETHLNGNALFTWNDVIEPKLNPRNPKPHHLVYEDSKRVNERAARHVKDLTEKLDEKVTTLERLHYSLNRGDATQKQLIGAADAAEELQRKLPDLREALGRTFAEQIATDSARQQKKQIKSMKMEITQFQEFLEGVESTLDDYLVPY